MSIATRLSDLIFEKRITQKQLAKDLNLAPSTINGYIKKQREPDIEILHKLAAYFDVTIDFLVDYDKSRYISDGDSINKSEIELIEVYRCLSKDQQELFLEQGKLFVKMNNKKSQKLSNTIS